MGREPGEGNYTSTNDEEDKDELSEKIHAETLAYQAVVDVHPWQAAKP
jgi:hypothetical protein